MSDGPYKAKYEHDVYPESPPYVVLGPHGECGRFLMGQVAEDTAKALNSAYDAGHAAGSIKWRPKSELPKEVEDGSRFVVAVEVVDEKYGQNYWDIAIVCVKCDEHYFSVESDGDIWGWSWEDIEWWMPIGDITVGLPALSAHKKGAGDPC